MNKTVHIKRLVVLLLFGCALSPHGVFAAITTSNIIASEQENIDIKVIVKDAKGVPIIGATVILDGNNTKGGISGLDGDAVIMGVPSNGTVTVSMLGMAPQKVMINNRTNFVVVLEEDALSIEEVVVVGFGTQKKVNVTGAVSMVGADVLEARPVQNVGQALQGVVPGLNFSTTGSGGTLDSNLSVNIRGAGSIGDGSNSSPLILIDGMEGNMNTINPNDILSVSVLKDAASSAIYGSRAAFGVILITTKSGSVGKTNVSYSGNVRFTNPIGTPDMLDSYTFAQYWNAASVNDGDGVRYNTDMMQRIQDYQAGTLTEGTTPDFKDPKVWGAHEGSNANTDWFDQFYDSWVPSQEHNLSINGGNEKVTYLLSGSFLDQNGLIKQGSDNFKRYTINARIKAELYDWLDLNYNVKWTREAYNRPSYMTPLFFHNISRTWPTMPTHDNNGHLLDGTGMSQMQSGGLDINENDYLTNQIQFVAEPIKDWRIVAEANMKTTTKYNHYDVLPVYAHNVDGQPFAIAWSGDHAAGKSSVGETSSKESYMTTNIYSDFSKSVNGHSFKVMGGFNAELSEYRNISGVKDGLITTSVPTLDTATSNARADGGYNHWSTAGFFGRMNYNYKEKYMAEVNARVDGTSRFIGDQRWGVFPSVSAGWNIAREDFFEPISHKISTLKLRASWGQLGNMNTSSLYPFYQTMPIGSANGSWLVDGLKPNTASAPGIVSSFMTWETVESWNIGIDWGMFNNRLTGTFEYFERATNDMIGPAPELPGILGTSVPKVNNADMRSYGFDLEVSWRDNIGDFSYGAKVVLSDAQQQITNYPNETGKFDTWYNGKMSGEIWGYETAGIAKSQEEMDNHLANSGQGALGSNWSAGDIMYKDLNGDGEINGGDGTLSNTGDKTIIGNTTARYNFGISLDAAWKGFDVSVFFQGTSKRDYSLDGAYFWGADGGVWQSAAFVEHMDFFRPEGDPLGANLDAYYPRPMFDDGGKNKEIQSGYLQNAAYIRLKNVQIGYNLPDRVLSKVGLQTVRVYVSADNLWTGTSLSSIFDPEALGGSWGNGKLYPLSMTVSVGLNINF